MVGGPPQHTHTHRKNGDCPSSPSHEATQLSPSPDAADGPRVTAPLLGPREDTSTVVAYSATFDLPNHPFLQLPLIKSLLTFQNKAHFSFWKSKRRRVDC